MSPSFGCNPNRSIQSLSRRTVALPAHSSWVRSNLTMAASADLLLKPIHPLGASVWNLDITNPDHLSHLPSLLYSNGIILLPANSQAPNAPPLNTVNSLEKIASSFGTVETEHPVNPLIQSSPVQRILTSATSSDSYIFHSDMTWNTSPSKVCVLCMVQKPESGGDTCFRSSTQMYAVLSPHTKEKLSLLSFVNSLEQSYGLTNQSHRVKQERTGVHPGVIRHPVTGEPCFYVNKNTTKECMGVSVNEGNGLLRRAYEETEKVEVYQHKWTTGDIIIWDNMGVQHMAMNDYKEDRVVFRTSVGEKWFRPDRFVVDRGVEDGAKDIRNRMKGVGGWVYDVEVARVFEHDMRECGYRLPDIVVSEVVKQMGKEEYLKEEMKVLDVGAGTGLVGTALIRANAGRFRIDAVDRSEAMSQEAKRRKIYEEYYVGDVNEGLDMLEEDVSYDIVVCVDGLRKNEIEVFKALENMVRVTKKGGVVVLTVSESGKEKDEFVQEVERLVGKGAVRVDADYKVVAFNAVPEFEFSVMKLIVL